MAKRKKRRSRPKFSESEREELERLRLKSEMDDMEIAYLKKLRALASEQVRGENVSPEREPVELSEEQESHG